MDSEQDRRMQAVQLYYYQKQSKAEICRRLHCTRRWLDRWLDRYNPDDVTASLADRKAGPKQPYSPWSAAIHQQAVAMRALRNARERWPYALVGAEAIRYEFVALKNPEVPPSRTLHRWFVAAELVAHATTPAPPAPRKPIPFAQVQTVNEIQQLDLKGPLYLRGDSQKYYLAVLRDRYSRRGALGGLTSRDAQGIVDFVVASWTWLGVPTYLQLDNALEFRGSNRYPRSFGRLVRVALDLGVEIIFNPPSEPWRNGGVEQHNGFLDKRLLEIELADFAALQAEAHKCQDACNQTHRLTVLAGLTPDEAVAQTARQLLAPTYAKHQARTLPQDKGFVSFIRLIRKSGRITLGAGDRFMVNPDLAYTYVRARVDLARQVVVISQDGQELKTYDYSADTVGDWAGDKPDELVNEPECNADHGSSEH
jgi:putative transposase